MNGHRLRSMGIALVLSLTIIGSTACLSVQTSAAQTFSQNSAATDREFTVTGRIVETDAGFTIQGDQPRELFSIMNPDPKALKELAKSGKTVTIRGKSVVGDNLFVESIDGKSYHGTEEQ